MGPVKTQYEVAVAWADITIDRWKKQLVKKKVGVSLNLARSFARNIIQASEGNVSRIRLMFAYYGRFVDMGVGRGVKIGDIAEQRMAKRAGLLTGRVRRAKRWYSPTAAAEIRELSSLLAKNFGTKYLQTVETFFKDSDVKVSL